MKLNLGSGQNPKQGYVNVDKYGTPDVLHDLETFPWPWNDNSIGEVRLSHVLEHLGESAGVYLRIWQEIYRVCWPDAKVEIYVPHPRHDDFIDDPTHVRAITPNSLWLFSKRLCRLFDEEHAANSPLALYLDVDFEIVRTRQALDSPWREQFEAGKISTDELNEAVKRYNNVIKETEIILKVVKPCLT